MITTLFRTTIAATIALVATASAFPQPAAANTATTAAIIAGAAAIVGGLLYDANNRPYYERGGRRVYVNAPVAQEYRNHGGRYRGPQGQWHGGGYRRH